mmetsp:Transcript_6271/g.16660  ORF Transcript_6271/g.16660 Transcript_6271/m.16660 type:complete len:107 (+) Transcript_6271:418-738(+)|eukprot:1150502-Pelagomonas_calceolata.AAC.12
MAVQGSMTHHTITITALFKIIFNKAKVCTDGILSSYAQELPRWRRPQLLPPCFSGGFITKKCQITATNDPRLHYFLDSPCKQQKGRKKDAGSSESLASKGTISKLA